MAIFTSGIPIGFLGYKLLHRPLKTFSADSLQAAIQANPTLPYFNDPRGLFAGGMVPSRQINYRIYHEVSKGFVSGGQDVVNSIPGFLGAATPILFMIALPEVVFVTVRTRTAIVVFEGRDIFDLPTDGIKRDGSAIVLPDNIYRVYHAGEQKLLGPDSSLSLNATMAFFANTPDNLARGTRLSPHAPSDALLDVASRKGKSLVDTGSNLAEVGGNPSYISYTSVDKPIFRDVVVMQASGTGFGIVNSQTGFILTDTAGVQTSFHVLRFVYAEDSFVPKGQVPKTRWRLSESYGILPGSGKQVFDTPKDLLSSLDDKGRAKNSLDADSKHFAYDLNEDQDLAEVAQDFACTPQKNGYSPALATAKMDKSSTFYDAKFKGAALDYVLGYAAGGGIMTLHSVTAATSNTELVPAFSYTSPPLLASIGKTGRLGLEYVATDFQGLLRDTVILASTKEAVPGVAVAYDDCVNVANVVDTFETDSGNVLVERLVDDVSWSKTKASLGKSVLGRFLLGEFPLRSDGKTVFVTAYDELDLSNFSDNVEIPAGYVATAILLGGSDIASGTFLLCSDKGFQGDGLFEASISGTVNLGSVRKIHVGMPPTRFSSAKAGSGLSLEKVFGTRVDSAYLAAPAVKPAANDPSSLQISKLDQQKFPVKGSNPSVSSDCMRGWSYLAFENGDRVDFAFKRFYSSNWVMIRDVVLRIPDNFGQKGFDAKDPQFPPASLPLVLNDDVTGNVLLFYVYKDKLLAKKIPNELTFSEAMASSDRLSIESEVAIIGKLHDLTSVVVYDGSGKDESDTLAIDLRLGKVKSVPKGGNEGNAEDRRPAAQYSCCLDVSGYVYAFVQVDQRIGIRRSSNLGDTWENVVSGDFRFIPVLPGKESPDPEEAPGCMRDETTNNILVFFFSGSTLMMSKIPSEILRSADAEKRLSEIRPKILIGEVRQDHVDRGIMPSKSVSGQGDVPPKLTPHRVAAYSTVEGYYRVFYKDEKRKLKSLISFDTGDNWQTEQQFAEKSTQG